MIKEYIEDHFKDKFRVKPSVTEINSLDFELVKKLTEKSHILWYHKKFFGEQSHMIETVYEYDPSGILIYTELVNENDDDKKLYNVFILSLKDKMNVVDFVTNSLIKKK